MSPQVSPQLIEPPRSESELIERAQDLAGITLGQLAAELGDPIGTRVPKGYVGQLLERALGATAKGAVPDFEFIGVELKTLPIGEGGTPTESTFVTTVDFSTIDQVEWQNSRVRRKLNRVLFVPVESGRGRAFGTRRVGVPFVFRMHGERESALRADWEHLIGKMANGDLETLTAHEGEFLQVRPKAANASVRTLGPGTDGPASVPPRGFYLRTCFTAALLRDARCAQAIPVLP